MNRQLIPSIVLLFGLTLDVFPAGVAPPQPTAALVALEDIELSAPNVGAMVVASPNLDPVSVAAPRLDSVQVLQ